MTPLYSYGCPACDGEWENYRSLNDRLNESCPECGETAVILIKNTARPVCCDYFSENLDAYITGPRQRKRLMRKKNMEEV